MLQLCRCIAWMDWFARFAYKITVILSVTCCRDSTVVMY